MAKQRAGTMFRLPSQATWNGIVDAAQHHMQRRSLSTGLQLPDSPRRDRDIALVKNSSGSGLDSAGLALQVSTTEIITDLSPDNLWLGGDTPAVPSAAAWGLSLRSMPNGTIDEMQFGGLAFAKVDVGDEQHPRADIADGSTTLESGWHGCKIVYKPTGTGVLDCVVDLSDRCDGPVMCVIYETGGIDADDSGEVTIWYAGAESGTPDRVTAWYSWMTIAGGNAAEGAEALIHWFRDQGKWVITELQCGG